MLTFFKRQYKGVNSQITLLLRGQEGLYFDDAGGFHGLHFSALLDVISLLRSHSLENFVHVFIQAATHNGGCEWKK